MFCAKYNDRYFQGATNHGLAAHSMARIAYSALCAKYGLSSVADTRQVSENESENELKYVATDIASYISNNMLSAIVTDGAAMLKALLQAIYLYVL